jgi:pimeloyl-ACP methyl ester carboxylesterase
MRPSPQPLQYLPDRRRLLMLGAALPAIAAAGAGSEGARAQSASPRTYVLVHGAWHGGWCWRRVVPGLQEAGHRVLTPTLTGLGDRAHLLTRDVGIETFIEDVIAAIEMEELSDVVLVGHSFAGAALIGAADRIPERIAHLVFVDAVLLQDGQSVFSTIPPDIVKARIEAAQMSSAGVSLPVPKAEAFAVTEPEDAAWLGRHLRPHPFKTYVDAIKLAHPMGNGRPATYIACTNPGYPPLAAMHETAKRQPGWTYREIGCGHDAMVLAPRDLTDMLLAIG